MVHVNAFRGNNKRFFVQTERESYRRFNWLFISQALVYCNIKYEKSIYCHCNFPWILYQMSSDNGLMGIYIVVFSLSLFIYI